MIQVNLPATWALFSAVVLMLVSLGLGYYYLARDKNDPRRLVKALTVRIALAVSVFVGLMLACALGWIQPHGLQPF